MRIIGGVSRIKTIISEFIFNTRKIIALNILGYKKFSEFNMTFSRDNNSIESVCLKNGSLHYRLEYIIEKREI